MESCPHGYMAHGYISSSRNCDRQTPKPSQREGETASLPSVASGKEFHARDTQRSKLSNSLGFMHANLLSPTCPLCLLGSGEPSSSSLLGVWAFIPAFAEREGDTEGFQGTASDSKGSHTRQTNNTIATITDTQKISPLICLSPDLLLKSTSYSLGLLLFLCCKDL